MLVSHAVTRIRRLNALLLDDRVRLVGVHQRWADGHTHRRQCRYPCGGHGEQYARPRWSLRTDGCGGAAASSDEARVALANTSVRCRDHVGFEGSRSNSKLANVRNLWLNTLNIHMYYIYIAIAVCKHTRINIVHFIIYESFSEARLSSLRSDTSLY